ncbi:unnamed protein product [Thlaspi arvense]|uniref:Uncharacterized protein n=1 Tax=Thlaspi arvense TaxID=13288 RepID=A0AAU9SHN1_THLAR|nr:unnamed protein product [Thlaspi arvense]
MTNPTTPYNAPTRNASTLKVKDLLCQTINEWDLKAIRKHLPQYEGQIRQLITGRSMPLDRLVWQPEKSGDYTVKLGCCSTKLLRETDIPKIKAINNAPTCGNDFDTAISMVALEHLDRQESADFQGPLTITGKHNLKSYQAG